MSKPNELRRIDSILRLQKNLHRYSPGSYLFEIYDKAIDLAVSENRKINEFFYYNLLRDARRILSRRKKIQPAFIVLLEPNNDEEGKEERNPFISDYFTPEQFVIHSNLIASLSNACTSIHRSASDVLQDMVDGLKIKESAGRLGLGESLVKKLRVEIKSLSNKILFN